MADARCCARSATRPSWRARRVRRQPDSHSRSLELVTPPRLERPHERSTETATAASEFDAVEHGRVTGIRGGQRLDRAALVQLLVECENGADENRPFGFFATHLLMQTHILPRLADARWSHSWAAAAAALSDPADSSVLVLGLGGGVAALTAARAGARVVWAIRPQAHAVVANRLSAINGVSARVRVVVVATWDDVPALLRSLPPFDAVIAEEMADVVLGDSGSLLALARLSQRSLLRPCGVFAPRRARLVCALASLRTTTISGFDLRGFNVFRSTDASGTFYDFEHARASEAGEQGGEAFLLSLPTTLLEIDFHAPPSAAGLLSRVRQRLVAQVICLLVHIYICLYVYVCLYIYIYIYI